MVKGKDKQVKLNKVDADGNPIPEKFQNPNKLGFMRFLMILFGFVPFTLLFSCFFISKEQFVLNAHTFNFIVDGLAFAVVFWMIWKRKKDTKYVVLIISLFDFVVTLTLCLQSGVYTNLITDAFGNSLICIYFWVSKRAKYCLTQPFILEPESKEIKKATNYYQPKKWSFWRDLIIIFCVFSVVGHWLEAAYCFPVKMGWLPGIYDPNSQIWSDWLFPFPIYGFGGVACALIFYPIKNALQKVIKKPFVTVILIFIISAIVCSLMELIMGLFTNADYSLWDYRTMWCNFMGQVCLQNSLGFGLAATIMTFIVYPLVKGAIAKLPKDGANVLFVIVVVFFCVLMVFYYINDFTNINNNVVREVVEDYSKN